MIRTWHGWREVQDQGTNTRLGNRMRKLPPQMVPRSARTDFSWIFWDPTGDRRRKHERERENTFLKHVPRWMRSSAFGSTDSDPDASRDVEAGVVSGPPAESNDSSSRSHTAALSQLGRHWITDQRRHTSRAASCSPDLETGTHTDLRHSSETRATSITLADDNYSNEPSVRMRKPTRRSSSSDDWQRRSEVIERATRTDLFTSPAARNLVDLFDPCRTNSKVYKNPESKSPRRLRCLDRGLEQMLLATFNGPSRRPLPQKSRGMDRSSEQTDMRWGYGGGTEATMVEGEGDGADEGEVDVLRVEKRRKKMTSVGEGLGSEGDDEVSYGEIQRREDLAAAIMNETMGGWQ
ncbi:MAG: hypothetical protein Q9183_006310 [Haloplaca sp. 2 TL-2023]